MTGDILLVRDTTTPKHTPPARVSIMKMTLPTCIMDSRIGSTSLLIRISMVQENLISIILREAMVMARDTISIKAFKDLELKHTQVMMVTEHPTIPTIEVKEASTPS